MINIQKLNKCNNMKVSIKRVAGQNVEIVEYISDYIIQFEFIELPIGIEKIKWNKYQEDLKHPDDYHIKELEKEREYRTRMYRKMEPLDELIKLNLKHCVGADYYFTNGQQIISVLKTNGEYQLAIHNSNFGHFTSQTSEYLKFSLTSFELKSYKFLEEIYAVATSILSNIKITRLQGSNGYLDIQNYFSDLHIVTYKEQVYQLRSGFPNKNIDFQFEELLKKLHIPDLICCLNCKYFKSITRGHLVNSKLNGDCEIIDGKLKEVNKTTYMLSWCHRFEPK